MYDSTTILRMFARKAQHGRMQCEHCGKWCDSQTVWETQFKTAYTEHATIREAVCDDCNRLYVAWSLKQPCDRCQQQTNCHLYADNHGSYMYLCKPCALDVQGWD
jgi:CDP-diacylglycerol pyrophosphatase